MLLLHGTNLVSELSLGSRGLIAQRFLVSSVLSVILVSDSVKGRLQISDSPIKFGFQIVDMLVMVGLQLVKLTAVSISLFSKGARVSGLSFLQVLNVLLVSFRGFIVQLCDTSEMLLIHSCQVLLIGLIECLQLRGMSLLITLDGGDEVCASRLEASNLDSVVFVDRLVLARVSGVRIADLVDVVLLKGLVLTFQVLLSLVVGNLLGLHLSLNGATLLVGRFSGGLQSTLELQVLGGLVLEGNR